MCEGGRYRSVTLFGGLLAHCGNSALDCAVDRCLEGFDSHGLRTELGGQVGSGALLGLPEREKIGRCGCTASEHEA